MDWHSYRGGQSDLFDTVQIEDEYLHPVAPGAHYETTETHYFGFNIPEERINGEIYFWYHPALGIATGGILIWQGMKRMQLEAECSEYRAYMPMPKTITEWTYPHNVSITMVVPGKEFLIQYADEARDTRLELLTRPVMPAAGRHGGGHFTQAMKTLGSLILRGKSYKIDGYFSRDRSWGETRTEASTDKPPIAWTVGVFDDNFAFHAIAFDSLENHPEWRGLYPGYTPSDNLLWGYIWDGTRIIGLRKVDQVVQRFSDGITPRAVGLSIVDVEGRSYEIRGTIEACLPHMCWPNQLANYCQTRWEFAGRVGWGDTQDCWMADMYRRSLVNR